MGVFLAFCIGFILGGIFGVIIMAVVVGAKKSRGNYFLPDDDLGEG